MGGKKELIERETFAMIFHSGFCTDVTERQHVKNIHFGFLGKIKVKVIAKKRTEEKMKSQKKRTDRILSQIFLRIKRHFDMARKSHPSGIITSEDSKRNHLHEM